MKYRPRHGTDDSRWMGDEFVRIGCQLQAIVYDVYDVREMQPSHQRDGG
jgi:hypothetical protein